MKSLLILFLSFLVFIQPLTRFGIWLSFELRRQEISKTLCEKKGIEGNTCQGRCYLKKELKRIGETEKSQRALSNLETEKQISQAWFILPEPVLSPFLTTIPKVWSTAMTLPGFTELEKSPPELFHC